MELSQRSKSTKRWSAFRGEEFIPSSEPNGGGVGEVGEANSA